MNDVPESERDQKLTRLLYRTLHEVPHRPAPATLQARVLDELRRRAAQPWWSRSFAHWPAAARAAFVFVCTAFAGLALLGGNWTAIAIGSWSPSYAVASLPAHHALGLLSIVTALATLPMQVVAPLWLYSALAAGAALYITLFGLGAVAYRTLYLKPLGGR